MKTTNGNMRVSLLALAVQGALLAMFAMPQVANAGDAAEDEVAALKRPENYVELGVGNVSQKSAKFGEYNGLNKSGANLIGSFSIMGGDAYAPFASAGPTRWEINGSELGTTSRALGGSVSNQGKWDLSFGYDELRHNISDTYQTPYLGEMGGNAFVLPSGFGVTNSTAAGTTPTGTNALTVAQKAAFRNVDLSSTRKNNNVNAGLVLNSAWSVKFDYNQLVQSGAKLLGFGSMANASLLAGVTGEAVSMLPMPTNYKTDTINLALNWLGEDAHATGSYHGSFFRDANDRVTFQTFGVTTGTLSAIETMSTAPNNDFHQLNLSGGAALTSTTKLTGGLSYGKNTQNSPYVYDGYSMVNAAAPAVAALNANIINTHADVKLVDQTTKALTLSASVKFDERNNRTASNFYYMNAISGNATHRGYFANAPVSNSKTQFELAGDYRVDKDQLLKFAYSREDVKRWCDQYAVGGLGTAAGPAGVNQYSAGTNCVVAVASKDDKLSATYKLKANEDLNFNVGYAYSQRKGTSDMNAITPRISLNGNANLAAAANTQIQGINAGDYRGFYPFYTASRKQQMLKAGVNWQAIEKVALGFGGKFTDDKYDSLYGVKAGNSWSLNFDADYSYSETGAFSFYLTQEHKQRDMTDLQRSPQLANSAAGTTATQAASLMVPSGATWSDRQKDEDTTVGLGLKQNGLMNAKLDLAADLSYTLGRTDYTTVLNYATTTSAASGLLTCASSQLLSCGSLPTIKNDVIQLKLTGNYKIDKSAKVSAGYLFQQMKSSDYYYNGLQTGMTSNTMLPTNQQSPNYKVHSVAASYSYLF